MDWFQIGMNSGLVVLGFALIVGGVALIVIGVAFVAVVIIPDIIDDKKLQKQAKQRKQNNHLNEDKNY